MAVKVRLTLHVRVCVAWWWPIYAAGVKSLCALTGRAPDPLTVHYWARRAVRLKLVKAVEPL